MQVGKFTSQARTALMLDDIMTPTPANPTSRTINDVSPLQVRFCSQAVQAVWLPKHVDG